MAQINIFEQASKIKLRFQSTKGTLTVEDLWDLPLQTGATSLNSVAKAANRALIASQEESFVNALTIDNKLELALTVVKHIIAVKLADRAQAEEAAKDKARRTLLVETLADKEIEILKGMTEKEIRKELKKLGD